MLRAQARDRKAELCQCSRLQVLHEHVGLGEHSFEQRLVVGLAEIEHHRLLAAIDVVTLTDCRVQSQRLEFRS